MTREIGDNLEVTGVMKVKAGTSSDDAVVGGVIYVTEVAVGNVGSGLDTLASFSVPANTLSSNGMSLHFRAWGRFVGTKTRRLVVRFGTGGVFEISNISQSDGTIGWWINGEIVRTGATSQKAMVTESRFPSLPTVTTGLNQTLSGAVTFAILGENVTDAVNDVVFLDYLKIWYDGVNT